MKNKNKILKNEYLMKWSDYHNLQIILLYYEDFLYSIKKNDSKVNLTMKGYIVNIQIYIVIV